MGEQDAVDDPEHEADASAATAAISDPERDVAAEQDQRGLLGVDERERAERPPSADEAWRPAGAPFSRRRRSSAASAKPAAGRPTSTASCGPACPTPAPSSTSATPADEPADQRPSEARPKAGTARQNAGRQDAGGQPADRGGGEDREHGLDDAAERADPQPREQQQDAGSDGEQRRRPATGRWPRRPVTIAPITQQHDRGRPGRTRAASIGTARSAVSATSARPRREPGPARSPGPRGCAAGTPAARSAADRHELQHGDQRPAPRRRVHPADQQHLVDQPAAGLQDGVTETAHSPTMTAATTGHGPAADGRRARRRRWRQRADRGRRRSRGRGIEAAERLRRARDGRRLHHARKRTTRCPAIRALPWTGA